jgi:CRISPR-associated protein Csd2
MKKKDIVLLISAKNCNPNGDPDADNEPRTNPDTNTGLITKGCIARKLRNFVQEKYKDKKGFDIYIKENTVLGETRLKTLAASKVKVTKKEEASDEGQAAILKNFWDVRTFGAIMTGKETVNCGQVKGPVQITMLESVDPVTTMELAITRCAAETPAEKKKASDGRAKTMGNSKAVTFGLYKGVISINPILAKQTGFNKEDEEALIDAVKSIFVLDSSAARPSGSMTIESLVEFTHESEYGNEQTAKLLRRVTAEKQTELPSSIDDYKISINKKDLPKGVSVTELI